MTNLEKAEELKKNGNFSMRSCWECNPAHEHLKNRDGLFVCFDCNRWWINGDFLYKEEHQKLEYKL